MTRYGGVTFDSQLEARWAQAWDQLGIRWDYWGRRPVEEGFRLGSDRFTYRPDFHLPDLDVFVEVKPKGVDLKGSGELRRWSRFRREVRAGRLPGRDVLLLVGAPGGRDGKRALRQFTEMASELQRPQQGALDAR